MRPRSSSAPTRPSCAIMKNWKDEPTVGINEGDGFFHNDSRFGMVHNTDQSMLVPVIRDGIIIAWVGATIHEGENGACEPGGMPSGSELSLIHISEPTRR